MDARHLSIVSAEFLVGMIIETKDLLSVNF